LFLDEPTAGVDVELRKDMWNIVRKLRQSGVTIILTTHYIEEAEEIADRIGVISAGELLLVEDKKVTYDTGGDGTGITKLLQTIQDSGLQLKDMQTTQSSLEDIFVTLVHQKSDEGQAA